ncbi:MAG TPA: SRPBCC family protein [Polyangiales bacterium]|nr:SRPBCC family protein [Polyangiales bacterium]
MANPAATRELDPSTLRDSIIARLPHRSHSEAKLRLPAIPALLDHYAQVLTTLFAGLGNKFDADETALLREILERELRAGFDASPFSKLVISVRSETPPETGVRYEIQHEVITLTDEYDEWVRSRTPPLFGAHPDAKLLSLAHALGTPSEVCVLDVGAGTGRNTLPLAREGFRIDAVELAPSLAEVLRNELAQTGLSARVFEGDALDPRLGVPAETYRLVVLAEVVASHFRSVAELRKLFERAAEWLVPGGLLVFSAFVANDDYEPDQLAKQASQVFWSCLFTRPEVEGAIRGLPFERISDESCYAFEHKNLPAQAWPPTGWFAQWSRGHDLFALPAGKPPHELRWLVYRRTDGRAHLGEKVHEAIAARQIGAPRERVFEAVCDPKRAARWFLPFMPVPGIASCEPFDSAQPRTRRRVRWTDDSVTHEELIASEAPLRLSYAWTNTLKGPLALLFRRAESDWMFAPTPSGTSVYWTYRFEPRYRVLAPLMRIAQGGFQRWMRASLQRLQAALEEASREERAGTHGVEQGVSG